MKPIVFRNYGGIHQLRIESAEDLSFIHDLHPALWAATSVQLESLQCDPIFLKYLNQDGHGSIRSEHLRIALRWIFRLMGKRTRMGHSSEVLRILDLDISHKDGQKLKEAALHILGHLKANSSEEIGLEQVRVFQKTYVMNPPNGDGVLPVQHVSDPDAARLAAAVLEEIGGTRDISGLDGINEVQLLKFLDRAKKQLAWKALLNNYSSGEIMSWGEDTTDAVKMVFECDAKIEEFFWQCDLVRLDECKKEEIRFSKKDLDRLDGSSVGVIEAYLAQAPLQIPNAEGVLNLQGTINPYYKEQIKELQERVLVRAQPDSCGSLTRSKWGQVKAIFEPYFKWQAQKPSDGLGELPEITLREYLEGPGQKKLFKLLLEDRAVQDELRQITDLEKLILYQRWLLELANNFVNFSALYDPSRRALFELGNLVIDGREFTFTMKVQSRSEHKKIAQTSKMFLVYAEITGSENQQHNFEIVAALTSGDQGAIEIGKRGIFYDLRGKEWDARVVDLVRNPISLTEAIKAPFLKAKKLLTEKVELFAGSKAGSLEKATTEMVTKIEKGQSLDQLARSPASPTPAVSSLGIRDLLLGGGIAFAAVGSSLVYLIGTLSQISLLKAGVVFMSIVAVVIFFSAFLGWNTLRKRDMTPLLEACGWAVNLRMYLTGRLGYLFSHMPHLPDGARKEHRDLVNIFLQKTGHGSVRRRRIGLVCLVSILFIVIVLLSSGPLNAILWSKIKVLLEGLLRY